MMLSQCDLFPHGLLPLHIFEPRYRRMLDDALSGERMFCIGTLEGAEEPLSPERCVHPASTAAFIRACVTQSDGCSNLLLQGLRRIRLSDFSMDQPYVTAATEAVETEWGDSEARMMSLSQRVREQALELVEAGTSVSSHVRDYLERLEDPEILGDLVAFHFVNVVEERHPLLEITSLETRLERLSRSLQSRLVDRNQ